jgi:hypothetical protein
VSDDNEWVSTTWDMIDAAVDTAGYRQGFVAVFLEFRGAVLDDMPLDAKGRPEVVNQSNFARHFGIAISTFHRWLGEWGGAEFAIEGERREKAEAAKERQSAKASRKNRDAVAQEVRRKVAESREDFHDKITVRRADDGFFWIDVATLLESDLPGREKARAVDEWLAFLDEEAQAIDEARARLLKWATSEEAGGAAA